MRGGLGATVCWAILISLACFSKPALPDTPDPDPTRFAPSIGGFVTWDSKNAVPENPILFVGSSSVRLWPTAQAFAGKPIVNNVVTHISSLQDPDVNAANDGIQSAAWDSLKESDIMPQIPEWPEVGDILSAAIAKAAAGGDVKALMTEAAERTEKLLKRAGYY